MRTVERDAEEHGTTNSAPGTAGAPRSGSSPAPPCVAALPSLRHLGKVLDERVELVRLEPLPEVLGMMSPWNPGAISVFGSMMISLMNALSLPLRTLSRSGPRPPACPRPRACGRPPQPLARTGSCRPALRTAAGRAAARGRRRLAELLQPRVEVLAAAHVRGLAHGRVAEPAQLGAHHRVVAELRGRHAQLVLIPGTASIFMRKAGTQKSWITSLDWTVNCTGRPAGTYSCAGGDLLAAGALVEEGPRELLADDAHVHRVGLAPSRCRSARRRRTCRARPAGSPGSRSRRSRAACCRGSAGRP